MHDEAEEAPEVSVDDLKQILIIAIRDEILDCEKRGQVAATLEFESDEFFESYRRHLNYFDIEYDVDDVWDLFRQILPECTSSATEDLAAGRENAILKAA